jgi:hypothetical protein
MMAVHTKWEFSIVQSKSFRGYDGAEGIWTNTFDDGESGWDKIKQYGLEGWELVSSMLLPAQNTADPEFRLVSMFKRPLLEEPAA